MTRAAHFNPSDITLAAHKLSCHRGGRLVFEGLDFHLTSGNALLIQGSNGAGKTSLLRMMAGFLPVSGGRLARPETPALYHYLGHRNALKKRKTVAENLSFWSGFFGHRLPAAEQARILRSAGLEGLAEVKTAALSAGQQRRLALTRLAAAPRPVWLLDEPLTGLDETAGDWLNGLARRHLSEGGLIMAAGHEPLAFAGAKLVLGAS